MTTELSSARTGLPGGGAITRAMGTSDFARFGRFSACGVSCASAGITGDGSVTSARTADGTVSAAGAATPGRAASEGITVKLHLHRGHVALAPSALAGARTPPARQYGHMAMMFGMKAPGAEVLPGEVK